MKSSMRLHRTTPAQRIAQIALVALVSLAYGTTSCKYKSHHCIDSNQDGVCDDHNHHATNDSDASEEPSPGRPLDVLVLEIEETGEATLRPLDGVRAWRLER